MAVFNLASNGDMRPDGLTTNNYDISVMCVQLVCVEIGRALQVDPRLTPG